MFFEPEPEPEKPHQENRSWTAIEAVHEPAITPSLFFTDEEVALINWDAVFKEW